MLLKRPISYSVRQDGHPFREYNLDSQQVWSLDFENGDEKGID